MKDGHPYWTEDFDERRAEQRRRLRSVPAEFLWRSVGKIHLVDDDRALAEVEMRRLADEEMGSLLPFFTHWEGREGLRVLKEALAEAEPLTPPPHGPFFEIRQKVETDPRLRDQTSMTNEKVNSLIRFVAFLTWADDLADDGYTDGRVSREN
jgi:hypothetical protein